MDEKDAILDKANAYLDRAEHLLRTGPPRDSYTWGLLASELAEADLLLDTLEAPPEALDRLNRLIIDLRMDTKNFQDREFLTSTKAERRRNTKLFNSASPYSPFDKRPWLRS